MPRARQEPAPNVAAIKTVELKALLGMDGRMRPPEPSPQLPPPKTATTRSKPHPADLPLPPGLPPATPAPAATPRAVNGLAAPVAPCPASAAPTAPQDGKRQGNAPKPVPAFSPALLAAAARAGQRGQPTAAVAQPAPVAAPAAAARSALKQAGEDDASVAVERSDRAPREKKGGKGGGKGSHGGRGRGAAAVAAETSLSGSVDALHDAMLAKVSATIQSLESAPAALASSVAPAATAPLATSKHASGGSKGRQGAAPVTAPLGLPKPSGAAIESFTAAASAPSRHIREPKPSATPGPPPSARPVPSSAALAAMQRASAAVNGPEYPSSATAPRPQQQQKQQQQQQHSQPQQPQPMPAVAPSSQPAQPAQDVEASGVRPAMDRQSTSRPSARGPASEHGKGEKGGARGGKGGGRGDGSAGQHGSNSQGTVLAKRGGKGGEGKRSGAQPGAVPGQEAPVANEAVSAEAAAPPELDEAAAAAAAAERAEREAAVAAAKMEATAARNQAKKERREREKAAAEEAAAAAQAEEEERERQRAREEAEAAAAARKRQMASRIGRAGTAFAALTMDDDDDDDGDEDSDDDDDDSDEQEREEQARTAAAAAAAAASARKSAEAAQKTAKTVPPPPKAAPAMAATPVEAVAPVREAAPVIWWGSEEDDAAQRLPVRLTIATFTKKGEHKLHANEDRHTSYPDLNAELLTKLQQGRHGSAGTDSAALTAGVKEGCIPPANAFFAVYDGHGGSTAAQHLASRLHLLLAADVPTWRDSPRQALVNAFALAEAELRQLHENNPEDKSGACATVGLLRGHRLLIASLGDCRALLIRREGHAEECVQMTHDHRATDSRERQRILRAGGQISDGRVWGALMPSRTFGDFPWKDRGPGLSAEPEVMEYEIGAADKYLVLGSDGLFDVLSNKAIARICSRMNSSAQKVSNELQKELRKKPTGDDTTMLVVQLAKHEAS